jgi:transcriptional regulator with XRE-family HTH domain
VPAVKIGEGLRNEMRRRRMRLGLTQTQLGEADHIGRRISYETVNRIENGRSTFARANNLAVLALRLKMVPGDVEELDEGYPQIAHVMAHIARQAGPPDLFSWDAFHAGEA